MNPWNPQPKYIADFDKIKCLEFTLLPGKTLYIPPYWWYSIKFNDNTSLSFFNYRTYMNNLAILPYICLHALQIQNVKRNVAKKISINELNKSEIITPVDNDELNNQNNQNNLDNDHLIPSDSTNIDKLPEPLSSENNIGSEL